MQAFYSNFSTLHRILWLEISGDLPQVKFISPVRQFHGKANSLMVIPPKYGKIWVSLSFSLVYISLVATIEYKMVHGFNQAVFKPYNFENFAILNLPSFQLCFRTGLSCHVEWEKNWIISVTASQK